MHSTGSPRPAGFLSSLARSLGRTIEVGQEMADEEASHELAIRTAVAVVAGGAGLLGPDAGAAATALTPAMETALFGIVRSLGQRRFRHAAQTLEDAAETAEPVEQLVQKAVLDNAARSCLPARLGSHRTCSPRQTARSRPRPRVRNRGR